jgi:hypothetical protein
VAEGSSLLLEEYFATGDSRFLEELLGFRGAKKLGAFAERWLRDPRPWARERLCEYLDRPLNRPGHEPLVKRLFKAAEAAGDDALMARFLVAFDRSVRRGKRRGDDRLVALRVALPRDFDPERAWAPRREWRLFSAHTRHYLRRRAWRYFRRLGFRDPKRYLAAVLQALPLYRDEDADDGVHFLDNWGLLHVLFHRSEVVFAKTHGWHARAGRALRELKPAPAFPEAWAAASGELFDLAAGARCRPVRRTAMAMVRARPDLLEKVPFDRVLRLLEHRDEELRAFGVDLLRSASGLESVPLEVWTRLLDLESLEVLEAVCDVMAKVVSPERFTVAQLLGFACAGVGPVARLGLEWLKPRALAPPEALGLAQVRSPSVAADAVALARGRLAAAPEFIPDWLLAFLDAPLREVRAAAWSWFSDEKRARHRLDLWAKLVESPYDDVRIAIVRHLERFAEIDTALRVLLARAPLETVWATVLLNVHRGSRAKRLAAAQVAEAIERDPERAPQLLPLLAVAARSVRAPEFRAGLAAVVRAATRRPEVAESVARHFPELRLAP